MHVDLYKPTWGLPHSKRRVQATNDLQEMFKEWFSKIRREWYPLFRNFTRTNFVVFQFHYKY